MKTQVLIIGLTDVYHIPFPAKQRSRWLPTVICNKISFRQKCILFQFQLFQLLVEHYPEGKGEEKEEKKKQNHKNEGGSLIFLVLTVLHHMPSRTVQSHRAQVSLDKEFHHNETKA